MTKKIKAMYLKEITLPVPYRDQAISLFTTIFGAKKLNDEMISFGNGANIILLEQKSFSPTPLTVPGSYHLCFETDDIEASVKYLHKRKDLTIFGEIAIVPPGPLAQNRWIYLATEWGQYIELMQWAHPPNYYTTTSERLFRNSSPGYSPIPGLLGIDHHGFTVCDFDTTESSVKLLGIPQVLRADFPFSQEFTYYHTGIIASGFAKTALYRFDTYTNIEIAQYTPSHDDTIISYGASLRIAGINNVPTVLGINISI